MEEVFSGPINFFREKIQRALDNNPYMSISLPQVSIEDLPLEVWAMPQIEGEMEAIQLL